MNLKMTLLFTILIFIQLPEAWSRGKERNKSIYAGFGFPRYSFMIENKAGKEEASLISRSKTIPTVGFQTRPKPFWSSQSWLRGSLNFSVSPFFADRQNTGRLRNDDGTKSADGFSLGAGVEGYMGYLNPTLVFYLGATDIIHMYMGLGFGAGFSSLKGDYYQLAGDISAACAASDSPDEVKNNCAKIKVDYSGINLSSNVMFVVSLGWVALRFELGGPRSSEEGKTYTAYNSMFSVYGQYWF